MEKMTTVYFNGITTGGCCIQNAMVTVRENYTMTEIVNAIRNAGYKKFQLCGMRVFADVPNTEYKMI